MVHSAIAQIQQTSHGTVLAKIDIKNAFRLLPVHPAHNIYIDTGLLFGLKSTPKLFNVLADLLSWIFELLNVSAVMYYLDDFRTVGPACSLTCAHNPTDQVCMHLYGDSPYIGED